MLFADGTSKTLPAAVGVVLRTRAAYIASACAPRQTVSGKLAPSHVVASSFRLNCFVTPLIFTRAALSSEVRIIGKMKLFVRDNGQAHTLDLHEHATVTELKV